MSQIKTLNGVQYTLPQYNDTGWGANTGNVLTQYMAAIADVTLQLSGGSFTLTADTNFGATFGLVSAYFTSRTANAASAGAVRLAKTDVVSWRNNANGANVDLSKDTSDNLLWATNKVYTAGGAAGIVNADISASAAIAYSKLALTGSIVNADIGASAAIAYSKLTLTGAIVNADISAAAAIAYSKLSLTGAILNADINASAAIARSKMAALTASRAMVTDGSGFDAVSAVTATELGYVAGVTSAIQTQLNATVANPLTTDLAAGSHKITGLAAGTANGNAVRYEQVVRDPANARAAGLDATNSIASGSTTVISFPTTEYDTVSGFSGTTTSFKWTAATAGKYLVQVACVMAGSATGIRDIYLSKNGGAAFVLEEKTSLPAGTLYISGSTTVDLAAGGYIQIHAFQNSGGNLDVCRTSSYMSVDKVGN